MPITKDDLQRFNRFADERLNSETFNSLVDLAAEWESRRREMEETVADIRQSDAEIENGNIMRVSEAFVEARKQLGLE